MDTKSRQNSRSTLKVVLKETFSKNIGRIFVIIAGALGVGLAQSLVLLSIGPALKVFIGQYQTEFIDFETLLPRNILTIFDWFQIPKIIERNSFLVAVPLTVVLAILIKTIMGFIYHYNHQVLMISLSENLRKYLYAKILKQRYLDFMRYPVGEWMSIITNDVNFIQSKLSDISTAIFRDVLISVSCLITLYFLHPPSALVLLLISPFFFFWMGSVSKRISYFTKFWQKALAELSSIVLGQRLNFDFIHAQLGTDREKELFQTANQKFFKTIRKSIFIRAIFAPALEFVGIIILIVALWIWNIYPQFFPSDGVIPIFATLALLFRPWRSIGEQLTSLQETRASISQIEVRFASIQSTDELGAGDHKPLTSVDHFEIVQCKTDLGSIVLNINNKIFKSGQTYAISGSSGTGKSTFLKIIAGVIFPDVWKSNIPLDDLSKLTSYASQNNFMFEATLEENLSYPASSLSQNQRKILPQLIEICQMREYFDDLEFRLSQTFIPTRSNLSGGQLQRLCLLRALLRDSKIIILDEISSALDVMSEEKLLVLLANYIKTHSKILITVTHRLHSLKYFDHHLIMQNGDLVDVVC